MGFRRNSGTQPQGRAQVMIRGCVSFSLYGESSKYSWGAFENVALVAKYYPGWQCRIYIERGHYAKDALIRAGAHVIEMEPLPGSGGMFWRFLAVDDPQFTHVIIRDADSRVNPRDVACTMEWIDSGKGLHVIRDHPAHLAKPIMGGAFGMRQGLLPMGDIAAAWDHNHQYGDDEKMLWEKVWNRIEPTGDFLMHCYTTGQACYTPIPAHEPYDGFVCEPLHTPFTLPGKWKALVLSPERYVNRRANFYRSLDADGGFLAGRVEWYRGTEAHEVVLPRHFPHERNSPHFYLATLDHMRILERAIVDGLDYLFVFEDDARFRTDFDEYLKRAFLAVPEGWMAIQLGGQDTQNRRYYEIDGVVTHPNALARVYGCKGTHGTLWTREGMIRAWNHFHYHCREMVVDWAFASLQREEPHFYTPFRWVVVIDTNCKQVGNDD
jgi:hypothetical protein